VIDHKVAQPLNSVDVMPHVSVIIPAYNAEDYLERALNSALAQTMSNLEIIVVDDASADDTIGIAHRIAAQDSRVRVLHNEYNVGSSISRNRAIDAARGEWIALLDADDAWFPERLEQMLASGDNADVVSDDVYIVRSSLIKLRKPVLWSLLQEEGLAITEPRWLDILDFVRHEFSLLQPIIRRSFLTQHRLAYAPTVRFAEDFRLYFEIMASGARWLQLPQGYYLYYKHANALTKNKRVLWQETIESAQSLFNHPAAVGDKALTAALERRIQKARGHVVFATVRDALRQRRFVELARSLVDNPSDLLRVVKFVAERVYLRVLWRIRRLRAHKLPRLPS
jgi:succinoglycan biosynthesis protein ExoO